MIVYIAGPITGVENYKENFTRAEEKLRSEGDVVLNPTRLPVELSYESHMRIDLAMVAEADVVYALKGWMQSKGAVAEVEVAKALGKTIWFE